MPRKKLEKGDALVAFHAVKRQQEQYRESIESRSKLSTSEHVEHVYPIALRAEHDQEETDRIARLERVSEWLWDKAWAEREREDLKAAKKADAEADRLRAVAEMDRLFGTKARATIDAIAGKDRCECGATLAHVAGPGVSGVLCPECDHEHLTELIEEPHEPTKGVF